MGKNLKIAIATAVGALMLSSAAQATVFSFDELFIEKGATAGSRTEIFRDSFNDGAVPASGPDDSGNSSGTTYTVGGSGFLSDNAGGNGRLLVDSALGEQVTNPNGDLRLRNKARRLRSTNSASGSALTEASAFSVNAMLDLTLLPQNPGEAFGVRIEDFAGGSNPNPNGGTDRILLEVRKGNTSGNLGVSLNGLNFAGVPIENFDFILLQPLLDTFVTADQILLSLTKDENTKDIEAEFSLFSSGSLLFNQMLDNVGNTSGQTASVFSDEDFTRAAIHTIETVEVPEPAGILVLAGGLLAFAGMRRRRR